jgi:hypothetical protein
MGKNKIRLRVVLGLVVLFSSLELHATLKENIAIIYTRQIGIREQTGQNDGRMVEEYLSSVGLEKGNPWCAAFVHWTFACSGVSGVPRSGFSPSWFQTNVIYWRGHYEKKPPDRADVFGIWFQAKKRIAHVGFVDEWCSGTYAITVEGNTNDAGSREGDGVYRKRRLKKQIYKISRWL